MIKYCIGKIFGIIEGIFAAILGFFSIIGIVYLNDEVNNRKLVDKEPIDAFRAGLDKGEEMMQVKKKRRSRKRRVKKEEELN